MIEVPMSVSVTNQPLSMTVGQTNPSIEMGVTSEIKPLLTKGYALRPDAKLVKKITYDKHLIADEVIESLPAYSTSAKTLVAATALEDTVTVATGQKSYLIVIKCLAIPEYSVTTKAKGRSEYNFSFGEWELVRLPGNQIHSILEPERAYATANISLNGRSLTRQIYYSSGTAIGINASTQYGTYFSITAPTYSSPTVSFTAPALLVRGNGTYFASTYFNAMTDIRMQYVIEVYEAPVLAAWEQAQLYQNVIDCANSNDHKLV